MLLNLNLNNNQQLKNKSEYLKWLSCLQEDDHVWLQQFHPKSFDLLDSPLEFWQFYWLKITFNDGNQIIALGHAGSSNSSHSFINGIETYINSDNFFKKTFYHRLVPAVKSLLPPFDGDHREYNSSPSLCTQPIFEPDWAGERHYLLQKLPRQDSYRKENISLKQAFPTYSYPVSNGELFLVFPGEDTDLEHFLLDHQYQTFQYLYSEPLDS